MQLLLYFYMYGSRVCGTPQNQEIIFKKVLKDILILDPKYMRSFTDNTSKSLFNQLDL